MTTPDTFSKWNPWWWYKDVPASIVAIHDDAEGFRVILNAEKCPPTRVSVAPGHLVMFRVYDEVSLSNLNPSGLQPGHSFYKAESSKLLVEAETMNILPNAGRPSAHYAIYTGWRRIDMICTEEPRFILLREFVIGGSKSERPERSS